MRQLKLSIKIILIIVLSLIIWTACDNINDFYNTDSTDSNSQVTTLTFSPSAGNYGTTQTVTLSTTTTGSTIWYTTDGSTPACGTGTSGGYGVTSVTATVTVTTTVNAMACQTGYTDSSVALAAYTIGRKTFETTTGIYDGNLGGITGADNICVTDTNYTTQVGGTGIYKALIVGGTTRVACTTANCSGGTSEHTDWVLQSNTNYYRSDGTTLIMITDANGIFVFGTLTNSIASVGNNYWTGLNSDWTNSGAECLSGGSVWTDNTGGVAGQQGQDNTTNASAINSGNNLCGSLLPLICVEQ